MGGSLSMSEQAERAKGAIHTAERGIHFSLVAKDGILSGVIGALMVAVWFLILDTIAGRPLYTPSLLGKILFGIPNAMQDPTVVRSIVAAYTGVHMAIFVVVGSVAAYLVAAAEHMPPMRILFFCFFVVFQGAFFVYDLLAGDGLIGKLGVTTVIIANLLAAGGMCAYFVWRHPKARRDIHRTWQGG
jgi:hypothetical protein